MGSDPLRRCWDWPARLDAAIAELRDAPFAWGSTDCGLAATQLVAAMTGVDIAADIRCTYDSRVGALRVIAERGGFEAMVEGFAAQHGVAEIPVGWAQRGDFALADSDDGPGLGVVALDGRHALFMHGDGLRGLPLRLCRRAWRVG